MNAEHGSAPGDAWPSEFVWLELLPPPTAWTRPGLVMFFNLECPGCVSRGVPFLKRLHAERGDALAALMIHTSYGRRHYPREQVVPQLRRFAESFARLPIPVALDLDGSVAAHHRIDGTPHWLLFASGGALLRSIYGSQDNARTRLRYAVDELLQPLPSESE